MDSILEIPNRPSQSLIDKFKNIPSSIISDVSGRTNVLNNKIKPVWKGAKLCGPAFTVYTEAGDNLTCHKAIELAKKGDIIIINAESFTDASVWGELMSISSMYKGIGGIIIDGACRDINEISELQFPVFAKAVSPRACLKNKIGTINHPIICNGVTISPGDILVGDTDGVVCIPQAESKTILAKALKKLEKENILKQKLNQGYFILDLLKK